MLDARRAFKGGAGETPTMSDAAKPVPGRMSSAQRAWLMRGLDQPGGKLPLFDIDGKRVNPRTIKSCIEQGWAEPWYANPMKPDWLVCKLTDTGLEALSDKEA
jgi:hypothetical protein